MKGLYFGAEQLAPGVVGLDYDDDYYRVEGTLVPLMCARPDDRIPRDTPRGALGTCKYCGAQLRRQSARNYYMPDRVSFSDDEIVCPTAHALRATSAETGPVYRRRPHRIDGTRAVIKSSHWP